MADVLLPDDPQTLQRLDSVACLFEWMSSMSEPTQRQFRGALAECSGAVQEEVVRLLRVVKSPATTPNERHGALTAIAEALFPNSKTGEHAEDLAGVDAAQQTPLPDQQVSKTASQDVTFAQRLRAVMEARRITQQELAERVGCSQPAISQMLSRTCRPQKNTILKLAEALNVPARDLWPDIEVAEMLDAVASFQQDDYVMTEAEARALRDTSRANRPKIQPKSLPGRR